MPYVANLEEGWTKEETDYLFSLVEEYDLRFVVISDRYDYTGSTRTVEVRSISLTHKFYRKQQKLICVFVGSPFRI